MGQPQPFFSIVIPTYNRPHALTACLEAIAQLDYPRERFEVLVVDDGGAARLDTVVRAFHHRLTITLLWQEHTGPAAARNQGAAAAKGTFLAFTDDDCRPAPGWLQAFAARFHEEPECMLGGKTVNALPDNIYSTASQLLIAYLYAYYNAIPHRARFFTSNNLAVSAEQFRAAGAFDTTYPLAAGEDRELCDRWLYLGRRMSYVHEAVVYHAHILTFWRFIRQHCHYGRGAYCFHRVRAQRIQERIRVEPLSFYLRMLAYPFVQTHAAWATVLALLLLATQIANAAGFFYARAQSPRQAR